MKILIAVDGSACSRRIPEYVMAHPALFGSDHEYMVLNVVPKVPPHAAAVVGRATVADYYRDEGEKVINPVRHLFEENGFKIEAGYRHGHSAETIANTAMTGGYDLLEGVMN